jgi:hypothetical protein
VPTPLNVDGAHQAVAADKVSDPQAAEKAKIFEARMTFRAAIFEAEINKAKLAMESGGIDKGSINGFVSNFTRATGVSQEAAMTYALTEMGGMIGPGSSTFTTMLHSTLGSLAPVWRHAVVHDAFGSIYSQFGWGWGYLYSTGGVGLLSAGNPLSGQVSGIAIGFTGGYSGGAQITTDLVRRSRGE